MKICYFFLNMKQKYALNRLIIFTRNNVFIFFYILITIDRFTFFNLEQKFIINIYKSYIVLIVFHFFFFN